LRHPTWTMGPVVTINSATMVNKALEVIEAHELFGIAYGDISVTVHPQSAIHSMVEFTDGSTIAPASPPDMRLPIAPALGWPARSGPPAPRPAVRREGGAVFRRRPPEHLVLPEGRDGMGRQVGPARRLRLARRRDPAGGGGGAGGRAPRDVAGPGLEAHHRGG